MIHLAIFSYEKASPDVSVIVPAKEIVRPWKTSLRDFSFFFLAVLRAAMGLGATFREGIDLPLVAVTLEGAIMKLWWSF